MDVLKKNFQQTSEAVLDEVFKKHGYLYFPTARDLQSDPCADIANPLRRRYKNKRARIPGQPTEIILLQEVIINFLKHVYFVKL